MSDTTGVRDRGRIIDRGFAVLQTWGIRIIVIAAALFVLGWVVGQTWVVIFPLCLALLISTVLEPPTRLLRSRLPDGLAAGIVMAVFVLVVVGALLGIIPAVATEGPKIVDSAIAGLGQLQTWLADGPLNINDAQLNQWSEQVVGWLQGQASAIGSGALTAVGTVTSAILNIVVTLLLVLFLLKDGHRFLPWLRAQVGTSAGVHLSEALGRVYRTLGGFIRTQALVSFIDAVLICIGFLILGVPLAIPLAILIFFGGFIPIVGALATGVLAVLVTLVSNGFEQAIIVVAIIVGVGQLESNVLSPWLQGRSMRLHAAVILLAVTLGGTLFGITGAFLSVPVAAALAEVLRYVSQQITAAQAGDPKPGPAAGGSSQWRAEPA